GRIHRAALLRLAVGRLGLARRCAAARDREDDDRSHPCAAALHHAAGRLIVRSKGLMDASSSRTRMSYSARTFSRAALQFPQRRGGTTMQAIDLPVVFGWHARSVYQGHDRAALPENSDEERA